MTTKKIDEIDELVKQIKKVDLEFRYLRVCLMRAMKAVKQITKKQAEGR